MQDEQSKCSPRKLVAASADKDDASRTKLGKTPVGETPKKVRLVTALCCDRALHQAKLERSYF